MSARSASRLAWSLWAATLGLVAVSVILYVTSTRLLPGGSPYLLNLSVAALGLSTVGALVASRRPGNSVGWLFGVTGLLYGLAAFVGEYSLYAIFVAPEPLPAGLATLWIASWLWILVGQMSLALFLFFPEGRLPSPRWRIVAALILVGILTSSATFALRPGSLLETSGRGLPPVENPLAMEAAGLLGLIEAVNVPLSVLMLAPFIALFVRYRRARGGERQQIKWVAYAAAMLTVAFVIVSVFPSLDGSALGGALFLAGFLAVPVAVGIAILKYRLYDIDLIIRKTAIYGALTASLALVYAGGVVGLQYVSRAFTGGESQLAVVASTLVIAALFVPLRRRIQSTIDRRFYRRKYDARRTLESFNSRLRDETDLGRICAELTDVAWETVQPEQVSLWLRPPGGRSRETEKP